MKKILLACTCLFLVSCSVRQPIRIPPDEEPVVESTEKNTMEDDGTLYPPEPEETVKPPSPRDLASKNLMETAMVFLEENKPDESIRSLERAVGISPGRGENYYYLAEAWYMKGNLSQAREYNSLAAIHLKDDARWMDMVEEQRVRIENSK